MLNFHACYQDSFFFHAVFSASSLSLEALNPHADYYYIIPKSLHTSHPGWERLHTLVNGRGDVRIERWFCSLCLLLVKDPYTVGLTVVDRFADFAC